MWKYGGGEFVLFTNDTVKFKVYKTEFINRKQSAMRTLATVTSREEEILKYDGIGLDIPFGFKATFTQCQFRLATIYFG